MSNNFVMAVKTLTKIFLKQRENIHGAIQNNLTQNLKPRLREDYGVVKNVRY